MHAVLLPSQKKKIVIILKYFMLTVNRNIKAAVTKLLIGRMARNFEYKKAKHYH